MAATGKLVNYSWVPGEGARLTSGDGEAPGLARGGTCGPETGCGFGGRTARGRVDGAGPAAPSHPGSGPEPLNRLSLVPGCGRLVSCPHKGVAGGVSAGWLGVHLNSTLGGKLSTLSRNR